mmetsp:Transcript_8440/g.16407  ORF Transcript_8440/g.16407 Transcript_8440/m.16407 type:complete len:211 (-) Transcript_8440:817-1449(-)
MKFTASLEVCLSLFVVAQGVRMADRKKSGALTSTVSFACKQKWAKGTNSGIKNCSAGIITAGSVAEAIDICKAEEGTTVHGQNGQGCCTLASAWGDLVEPPVKVVASNGDVLADDVSCEAPAPDPISFACKQQFQSGFKKNCSAGMLTADSVEEAMEICKTPEGTTVHGVNGQGCCDSAKVYTNAYGPVTGALVIGSDGSTLAESTDCAA